MMVGYARISTSDQNLDLQIDALNKVGCEKIFQDVASGAKSARPGLQEALSFMRTGDILTVWRIDRLGRSLRHLISVIAQLGEEGKQFKSLQENLDTSKPTGRLVMNIMAVLAEFERELIRERTMAGLAAARARGRVGGRPRVLDEKKIAMARSMLSDRANSIAEVARTLGVSKATLYSYLNQEDGSVNIDPGQDE